MKISSPAAKLVCRVQHNGIPTSLDNAETESNPGAEVVCSVHEERIQNSSLNAVNDSRPAAKIVCRVPQEAVQTLSQNTVGNSIPVVKIPCNMKQNGIQTNSSSKVSDSSPAAKVVCQVPQETVQTMSQNDLNESSPLATVSPVNQDTNQTNSRSKVTDSSPAAKVVCQVPRETVQTLSQNDLNESSPLATVSPVNQDTNQTNSRSKVTDSSPAAKVVCSVQQEITVINSIGKVNDSNKAAKLVCQVPQDAIKTSSQKTVNNSSQAAKVKCKLQENSTQISSKTENAAVKKSIHATKIKLQVQEQESNTAHSCPAENVISKVQAETKSVPKVSPVLNSTNSGSPFSSTVTQSSSNSISKGTTQSSRSESRTVSTLSKQVAGSDQVTTVPKSSASSTGDSTNLLSVRAVQTSTNSSDTTISHKNTGIQSVETCDIDLDSSSEYAYVIIQNFDHSDHEDTVDSHKVEQVDNIVTVLKDQTRKRKYSGNNKLTYPSKRICFEPSLNYLEQNKETAKLDNKSMQESQNLPTSEVLICSPKKSANVTADKNAAKTKVPNINYNQNMTKCTTTKKQESGVKVTRCKTPENNCTTSWNLPGDESVKIILNESMDETADIYMDMFMDTNSSDGQSGVKIIRCSTPQNENIQNNGPSHPETLNQGGIECKKTKSISKTIEMSQSKDIASDVAIHETAKNTSQAMDMSKSKDSFQTPALTIRETVKNTSPTKRKDQLIKDVAQSSNLTPCETAKKTSNPMDKSQAKDVDLDSVLTVPENTESTSQNTNESCSHNVALSAEDDINNITSQNTCKQAQSSFKGPHQQSKPYVAISANIDVIQAKQGPPMEKSGKQPEPEVLCTKGPPSEEIALPVQSDSIEKTSTGKTLSQVHDILGHRYFSFSFNSFIIVTWLS